MRHLLFRQGDNDPRPASLPRLPHFARVTRVPVQRPAYPPGGRGVAFSPSLGSDVSGIDEQLRVLEFRTCLAHRNSRLRACFRRGARPNLAHAANLPRRLVHNPTGKNGAATLVWGSSCALFHRYRTLWVLGLAQGLLALCVPDTLHPHLRVGFGYLRYHPTQPIP